MLYGIYVANKKVLPNIVRILFCAAALSVTLYLWRNIPNATGRNFVLSGLLLFCCWEFGQLMRERSTPILDFIASHVFTFYIYSWPAQAIVERGCSRFSTPWTVTTLMMFFAGMLCPLAIIFLYRRYVFLHCRFIDLVLGIRT